MRIHTYCAALLTSACAFLLPHSAGAQTMVETYARSTAMIGYVTQQGAEEQGTGFFVGRRPGEQGEGRIVLVTNKHVLPREGQPQDLLMRVQVGEVGNNQTEVVRVPVVGADGRYLPTVRLHPGGADVAAVDVTSAYEHNHIVARWISVNSLATQEIIRREGIGLSDEIFVLGYPASVYDARNSSPVLRMGVIATSPLDGYAFNPAIRQQAAGLYPDHIDGFLIDANIYPGASGSLVILRPQPVAIGLGGAEINDAKKVPYVLGIVSGSIPMDDAGLGVRQRIGLGIVFSADVIRTVFDSFDPPQR